MVVVAIFVISIIFIADKRMTQKVLARAHFIIWFHSVVSFYLHLKFYPSHMLPSSPTLLALSSLSLSL